MGDMRDAVVAAQQLAQAIRGFGQINIPLGSCVLAATGAPLIVHVDGTDGMDLVNSETLCYRWNNTATPPAIGCNVAMPQDFDPAYDITFHALVSKTGATVGDAASLTVTAFIVQAGALHDADADFGGDTNAVVGDATAKTTSELIRTLATANLISPPCFLALTFAPKAGKLGTDDFLAHAVWLEYTRKLAS